MRILPSSRAARVAGVVALWGIAVVGLAAAPVGPDKGKSNGPDKIRKELDQTINLDINEQPLNLALNQIREQTKLNFFIDKFTMAQMGIDPEQTPVTAKFKDVKVRSALRTILAPYNLSYAILGDTVLITSDDMAMFRQMRQRVNIDFEEVEFATALKQLSRETATNLIVDKRAIKEAKETVTLQMEDVPLETAVRLMAEMIGLKPVRVGNTLFVTTKANANEMRADPDLAPPPQPGRPGMEQIMLGGMAIAAPGMPGGAPVPVAPPGAPGKAIDPEDKPEKGEKADKDKGGDKGTDKDKASDKDKGDKPEKDKP
jgi:hypothetical protein